MLTIRDEQMAALRASRTAAFERQLRARLELILPERGVILAPATLDLEIGKGCADAGRFHITREIDVARFIELVLTHWGAHPEAGYPRHLLANLMAYGLDGGLKLDRFEMQLGSGVLGHD
jgi:hypothetical protein